MKGLNLNINPVGIKNKIIALKNELKDYYTGADVFHDDKTETKAHILELMLGSLAVVAAAGIAMKFGKSYALPKLSVPEFRKDGYFRNGLAYYKGNLFNGKIIKPLNDDTVSTLSYYQGRLKNVVNFDSISHKFNMQKKYMYDEDGRLKCVATKMLDNILHSYYKDNGIIAHYKDGKLSKKIVPLKDSRIKVIDYSDAMKGVVCEIKGNIK